MTCWKRWYGIGMALTFALLLTLSAVPAAADPPSGGCPADYELLSRSAAVRLVLRNTDWSRQEANAFIDTIDKNEDNRVCVAPRNIPGGYNYIDNRANR